MLMEVRTLPHRGHKGQSRSRSLDRGGEVNLNSSMTVDQVRAQCQGHSGQPQGQASQHHHSQLAGRQSRSSSRADLHMCASRGQSAERVLDDVRSAANGSQWSARQPAQTLQEALMMFRQTLQQGRRDLLTDAPPPPLPLTSPAVNGGGNRSSEHGGFNACASPRSRLKSLDVTGQRPHVATGQYGTRTAGHHRHHHTQVPSYQRQAAPSDDQRVASAGQTAAAHSMQYTQPAAAHQQHAPHDNKAAVTSLQSSNKLLEQFLERKRNTFAYSSLPRLKLRVWRDEMPCAPGGWQCQVARCRFLTRAESSFFPSGYRGNCGCTTLSS